LFDALAKASSRDEMKKMNARSLANMAWAYATARDARQSLFDDIANEAITRDAFAPQGISTTLWAFATTNQINEQLFERMAVQARESLDEFNSQALSNLAWAYAVADIDDVTLFGDEAFLNRCLDKMDEFDKQGLAQLHQWNLWRKHLKAHPVLPEVFAQRCHKALSGINDLHQSRLQKDVVSELRSMGIEPNEEVQTQSGYVIDCIVEIDGKTVGIEVDGPSHFIGSKPDGGTVLKHRQVANNDKMPLISIPYYEWNELKSQADREQYLRSKLKS
jgi:hypothetical protein